MVPRFQWTASSESVRDLSRLVAYCTALRAMPKCQCPCGGPCKQASVSGGWCGECSGIKRGQRGGAFGAGVDYQKRTCQKHPLPGLDSARVYSMLVFPSVFCDFQIMKPTRVDLILHLPRVSKVFCSNPLASGFHYSFPSVLYCYGGSCESNAHPSVFDACVSPAVFVIFRQ